LWAARFTWRCVAWRDPVWATLIGARTAARCSGLGLRIGGAPGCRMLRSAAETTKAPSCALDQLIMSYAASPKAPVVLLSAILLIYRCILCSSVQSCVQLRTSQVDYAQQASCLNSIHYAILTDKYLTCCQECAGRRARLHSCEAMACAKTGLKKLQWTPIQG
jgi:hypothetical protein